MSDTEPERPGLIFRFLSSTLLVIAAGFTVILMIVGYELALWILESGYVQGQTAKVVVAVTPSLCALLSLPFWLTLQRMNRQ